MPKRRDLPTPSVRQSPPRRWASVPLPALSLMLGISIAACTGSPGTLALRPDFGIATPAGIASVSIRQAPPDMTDAQFLRLVETGMEQAAPMSVSPAPLDPPFPTRRIVWHVIRRPEQQGTSRLVVNVFNARGPYAYEEDVIANGIREEVLIYKIRSLTSRLLADIAAYPDADTPPDPGGARPHQVTSTDDAHISPGSA